MLRMNEAQSQASHDRETLPCTRALCQQPLTTRPYTSKRNSHFKKHG